MVNSVNERDFSLPKCFRCGSYLITSWRDSACDARKFQAITGL